MFDFAPTFAKVFGTNELILLHYQHITHCGNHHVRTQLIESSWNYRHHPYVGIGLQKRQEGASIKTIERSYNAQKRLSCRTGN